MFRRIGGWIILSLEVLTLTALILASRCANYHDVFVGDSIYFIDADCYARMTRVRLCARQPGLIVRHHDFENFPAGTDPHTTAPLDYLIVGLALFLKPFLSRPIDVAGAWISPVLAMLAGWFLWWWSRKMKIPWRWSALILFAISPILVHGTELGRPDHQSLIIVLVLVAICAEWSLQTAPLPSWSAVSGIAWGLALWVSAYEPLILLLLALLGGLLQSRRIVIGAHRRTGWICLAVVLLFAFAVERRLPAFSVAGLGAFFHRWAGTIGELSPVPPFNPIWFRWTGYTIVLAPILIFLSLIRNRRDPTAGTGNVSLPIFLAGIVMATYGLTIWQARWGYFFVLAYAIALPVLLGALPLRFLGWTVFVVSLFPILRDWDDKLWPNEQEVARRLENRHEAVELRELALNLLSSRQEPFLAPWWLSPSIAYWSGQPGVAGSSHESLPGIIDSARFFMATNSVAARQILERHGVCWVLAYDADRVEKNSAELLKIGVQNQTLCRILDRRAAQTPPFLVFSAQNGTGKLFRVANNR